MHTQKRKRAIRNWTARFSRHIIHFKTQKHETVQQSSPLKLITFTTSSAPSLNKQIDQLLQSHIPAISARLHHRYPTRKWRTANGTAWLSHFSIQIICNLTEKSRCSLSNARSSGDILTGVFSISSICPCASHVK